MLPVAGIVEIPSEEPRPSVAAEPSVNAAEPVRAFASQLSVPFTVIFPVSICLLEVIMAVVVPPIVNAPAAFSDIDPAPPSWAVAPLIENVPVEVCVMEAEPTIPFRKVLVPVPCQLIGVLTSSRPLSVLVLELELPNRA